MELVWLFFVAIFTINVSNAKSIIDNITEKEVNKSSISKGLRTSPYVIATRRNNSIFPNMPNRREKFVVNLKPTLKTVNQTYKMEKSSNRLMKNLPIKYVNYYGTTKLPTEKRTRSPLMQIRKFTVKPHDIYAESVREKNNWNSNRKLNTKNSRKPKSERYTTEKYRNKGERFFNIKNVDSSINNNDSDKLGKEEQKNSYPAAGLRKTKTTTIPKHNNTKHLKVDSEQKTFNRTDQNKSDVDNNQNISTENKENIIISSKVLIKSEPKDNSTDQEKTDRSEIMVNNGVKNDGSFVGTNIISTTPAGVVGKVEMISSSDSDFLK